MECHLLSRMNGFDSIFDDAEFLDQLAEDDGVELEGMDAARENREDLTRHPSPRCMRPRWEG